MTKTESLIERRRAVVPRGIGIFAGEISARSASKATIEDEDGRKFLDFSGGIGVMNVGHGHPAIVQAIQQQAARLQHTCIHVATYEPYVALCEELSRILPHGGATKVMLANSGAEAVENAVKIARQATGRSAIICFEGGFHGRTLLGMTLTGKSGYKKNCGPFAPEVYRVPFPSRFHRGDGLDEESFVARELRRFEDRFTTGPVPASHVAAVVIEPVQGEGGFATAPPSYLQGLRRICDQYGILLICDEVQSGFGRTGKWAAYEHSGIVPDISTWAKSMGAGLPISAVVGRTEVMDAAEPGTIGGTYGGNPIACAAALATIRVIEEEGLNDRALHIGSTVRQAFERLRERHTTVGDVRGLGAMMAMEFCYDRDPSRPAGDLVAAITKRCRQEGLILLTAGPYGNILRVLSPLVISDEELTTGLDIIARAVDQVSSESLAGAAR